MWLSPPHTPWEEGWGVEQSVDIDWGGLWRPGSMTENGRRAFHPSQCRSSPLIRDYPCSPSSPCALPLDCCAHPRLAMHSPSPCALPRPAHSHSLRTHTCCALPLAAHLVSQRPQYSNRQEKREVEEGLRAYDRIRGSERGRAGA